MLRGRDAALDLRVGICDDTPGLAECRKLQGYPYSRARLLPQPATSAQSWLLCAAARGRVPPPAEPETLYPPC